MTGHISYKNKKKCHMVFPLLVWFLSVRNMFHKGRHVLFIKELLCFFLMSFKIILIDYDSPLHILKFITKMFNCKYIQFQRIKFLAHLHWNFKVKLLAHLNLVHGITKSQTWLSYWTTTLPPQSCIFKGMNIS